MATTKKLIQKTIEQLTDDEVLRFAELNNDLKYAQARESFWEFRQLMSPKFMLDGQWFPRLLSRRMRKFHDDMLAGKRPIALLATPPQHGKSLAVLDFVAWAVGHNPDLRVIYSSFSDRLSVRANLRIQRALDSPVYQQIFPWVQLGSGDDGTQRNSSILEFKGREGYFRNTTVLGSMTGESLDLGVIDDPIKGHAEAHSAVVREKVWNWLTEDVFSRFSEKAGLLFIGTRWHVDDPAGRLLEQFGSRVHEFRFPALAERDEKYRRKGEPLFPDLKSSEFLADRRKLYTEAGWQALYQQTPIVMGGGIFPTDKLTVVPVFSPADVQKSVRYVDKAGSADAGAYTAMVLMHQMKNGTFVIGDVVRGQWSALDREQRILSCAKRDTAMLGRVPYEIIVEQEPGSGGKESAEATIRNLRGFRVFADKVTGSKEVRAEPFAAQVQGGNVSLVAGMWVRDFISEAEVWPNGKYLDQIDAASGAFNRLAGKPYYNLEALAS